MEKKSYAQVKSFLQKDFRTYEFQVVTVGSYKAEDSDWNYKDVPHLNIVHSQVDSMFAWMGHSAIASINFQKIFFFTIPMIVFNYEYKPMDQVYFTCFGPFILLVNTNSKNISTGCQVTTRYFLASKPPFNIIFKLLKKLIVRNYNILMSEDTPMRVRRGVLRRAGHIFYNPYETYSYDFTTKLNLNNVRLKDENRNVKFSLSDLYLEGVEKIGEPEGVLSFIVTKKGSLIELWPSTCPHEGAELKPCSKMQGRLNCPWHGRVIKPLITIKGDEAPVIFEGAPYLISVLNEKVTVKYKP